MGSSTVRKTGRPNTLDEEAKAGAYEALAGMDTFLLGRATYEKFSAVWPNIKGDRFFDRVNSLKKLVAGTTRHHRRLEREFYQGKCRRRNRTPQD
jgi:hypothetical protein